MAKPSSSQIGWGVGALAAAGIAGTLAVGHFSQTTSAEPATGAEAQEIAAEAEEFFDRLRSREDELIRSGGSSIVRDGAFLRITTADGTTAEFRDCLDCGPEKDVEHYLVERLSEPDAVIIYRQYYEGDDYVLVTASGGRHEIPSWPLFSPDRKSFAVVSTSEAFNWNGLEVWDLVGDRYGKTFSYEPKEYELYRFLDWDGNAAVKLEFSMKNPTTGADECRPAVLRRFGHGWKLEKSPTGRAGFCDDKPTWIPAFMRPE